MTFKSLSNLWSDYRKYLCKVWLKSINRHWLTLTFEPVDVSVSLNTVFCPCWWLIVTRFIEISPFITRYKGECTHGQTVRKHNASSSPISGRGIKKQIGKCPVGIFCFYRWPFTECDLDINQLTWRTLQFFPVACHYVIWYINERVSDERPWGVISLGVYCIGALYVVHDDVSSRLFMEERSPMSLQYVEWQVGV